MTSFTLSAIRLKSLQPTYKELKCLIVFFCAWNEEIIRKKPLGVRLTPEMTNYLVKFKQKNGKFYFNYARSEVKFKVKWKRRLFNTNYTIMSEIAVTDRTEENVTTIPRDERLRAKDVFAEKVSTFTEDNFWGEYNYIEPDESIEAAIKKYGQRLLRTSSKQI